MAKKSHHQRAKEMLEELGYRVGDTEWRDKYSGTTYDLFGFIDLLAFDTVGQRTIAIQVTSGNANGNVAARVRKCLESPLLPACLAAGWLVEVWGVRDIEVKDGSKVKARTLELSEDGTRVIAFEGSTVLHL